METNGYLEYKEKYTCTCIVTELRFAYTQSKWWYWLAAFLTRSVAAHRAKIFHSCTYCTMVSADYSGFSLKEEKSTIIPSTLIWKPLIFKKEKKKKAFLFPSLIRLGSQNQIHIIMTQISPLQSTAHYWGCLHCCFSRCSVCIHLFALVLINSCTEINLGEVPGWFI